MAVANVQRIGKGGITTSLAVGSGDGWATPTSGNLLVVFANADATVTAPSGSGTWTAGSSVVDNNAAYSWYKFSLGTETTITCAPSVNADIALCALEYSGISAFDVQNSSTISGSPGGTATTSVSVTTTAASDLIVALAGMSTPNNTANPTAASWTGSLIQVLAANSQTSGFTAGACASLVGELLDAGTAGVKSTAASWTNGFSNRQEIVLAFKAAATAAASPHPRTRGPNYRR